MLLAIVAGVSCLVPVLATDPSHASATAGESSSASGYWLVTSDGGIFAFGDAGFHGSIGGLTLNKSIVGMAATPDGGGYWLVTSDGGIFAFGDAGFHGSIGGLTLNKPIVGMAATPDGGGYCLVASDGGIFAYGDASFHGSMGGLNLNKPIVGMAAAPDGGGYWLVASDGGIFAYGDAAFYGSTGDLAPNKPIVGMAATPDGGGYWLVTSDGGVLAYGDAAFYGSGGLARSKPIVATAPTPDGRGYWLATSAGGVLAYGDAALDGATGTLDLNKPIVGVAVRRPLAARASPLTTTTTTTTPTLPSGGMPTPVGYTSSQLILDEWFTGTSLDTNNWVTYLGSSGAVWNDDGDLPLPYSGPTSMANGGTGFNEAMYGPSQVRVDNGLTLTAQPNTNQWANTYPWISGIVTTEGKFTLPTTGWYVQVRAKMPDTSEGMWPAIWFLPPVGGTPFNEVDGFEGGMTGGSAPQNQEGSANYHADQGQQGSLWSANGPDMSAGYHTYGVRFIPGQSITAYFDGRPVWQVLASSGVTITAEPYQIMLELAVGSQNTSGWHTATNASTPTASMEVAEVQAYS